MSNNKATFTIDKPDTADWPCLMGAVMLSEDQVWWEHVKLHDDDEDAALEYVNCFLDGAAKL